MAGVGATCRLSFGLYSVSSHGTARVLSVKTVQGFRMTQAYGQSKLKEERERMSELYLPTELTSVKKTKTTALQKREALQFTLSHVIFS